MKTVLGSVVFLVSLFGLRQILIGAGLLDPLTALLFVGCLVGIPLGGVLFLEGALESEQERMRRELDAVREELAELRRLHGGDDDRSSSS